MATEVFNLRTGDMMVFSTPPEVAVIEAYAQNNGDCNTWDREKYKSLMRRGRRTVACGDWCAVL